MNIKHTTGSEYEETLHYLFNSMPMYQRIGGLAYKASLENAHLLDIHFNFPHRRFKTIHVAGTNGKGSVSHMLASVLQAQGYRTGLYTSPHLLDFRERIKVNGTPVTEEFVVKFAEGNKAVFEEIKPSFFEMSVFMAFDYFVEKGVDIAIIEVGLGGRLDTTNIITPQLSVITNIGFDHMQYLGNTLAAIAYEKAGIIKFGIPVVLGETHFETKPVFEQIAIERHSAIVFAEEVNHIDYMMRNTDGTANYHLSKCSFREMNSIKLDLIGFYQKKNLATVLTVLHELVNTGIKISAASIEMGLNRVVSSTGLLGRWQEEAHNPLVVCDTAHNADGIKEVLGQIAQTPFKQLHMILGFVADKDINSILMQLPPTAEYYLCQPDIPRAKKVEELAKEFEALNLHYSINNSVYEACINAKEKAAKEDFIYIGGSTFVVADYLTHKKNGNIF